MRFTTNLAHIVPLCVTTLERVARFPPLPFECLVVLYSLDIDCRLYNLSIPLLIVLWRHAATELRVAAMIMMAATTMHRLLALLRHLTLSSQVRDVNGESPAIYLARST